MKNLLIFCLCLFFVSCDPFADQPPVDYELGGGAFIVNEGQFLGGNGSLSFFSYDSMKIYNDLFRANNGRPLGDVPNYMISYGDNAYIVVNNSGKIEVIDQNSYKSKATITGLISPRNMAILNERKAYVTSLYSDSIAILDLYENKISGYINMGRSSEAIILTGSLAYVTNWLGGNKVYVINTMQNKVIDSISVGLEPESLVMDRYFRIWVLCTGGWQKTQKAELTVINTGSNRIEQKFVFPSVEDSPSNLIMDPLGQNIYYLNKGVWRMNINATELPTERLISEAGQTFYKMALNPATGDILVTDVADYVQNGYLLIYRNDGTFSSKHQAGLIPGYISFKFTIKQSQSGYLPASPGL